MEYSIEVSLGGNIGVDVGGEVKANVGWFDIRAGLVGSGTVTFQAWKLTAQCDNFNLERGGIGGIIGVTAHLATKSISKSWGAGELMNLL